MKPEKIKLVIDGKTIERGKLSKKDPRMVFYIEHSKITERLKAGRPADQAAAGYAERAAAEILEAALSALEDLAAQDPKAARHVVKLSDQLDAQQDHFAEGPVGAHAAVPRQLGASLLLLRSISSAACKKQQHHKG